MLLQSSAHAVSGGVLKPRIGNRQAGLLGLALNTSEECLCICVQLIPTKRWDSSRCDICDSGTTSSSGLLERTGESTRCASGAGSGSNRAKRFLCGQRLAVHVRVIDIGLPRQVTATAAAAATGGGSCALRGAAAAGGADAGSRWARGAARDSVLVHKRTQFML